MKALPDIFSLSDFIPDQCFCATGFDLMVLFPTTTNGCEVALSNQKKVDSLIYTALFQDNKTILNVIFLLQMQRLFIYTNH